MNKLIKLSEDHYIVVNDSEIKEGDWFLPISGIGWELNKPRQADSANGHNNNHCIKITHSSEPLEECGEKLVNGKWKPAYVFGDNVQILSLSEVEEVVYGYNVEAMANDWLRINYGDVLCGDAMMDGFNDGFKAHRELAKNKLFTIEDMMKGIEAGFRNARYHGYTPKEILQSLLPKTEWDVTFDEQGKLILS